MSISYALLNGDPGAAFHQMTFPAYRQMLHEASPDGPVFALAAYDGWLPVGLILGRLMSIAFEAQTTFFAEITSLFVDAGYRRKGIASELVGRLEQQFDARGAVSIRLTYMTGRPAIAGVERLIQKHGYAAPRPSITFFRTDTTIQGLPWLEFELDLPKGVTLFPWGELTDTERGQVQAFLDAHPDLRPLSPFDSPEQIDPEISLGARWSGGVGGWIITHRIDAQTLRYTSLFVDEGLRGMSGTAIRLMTDAIQRHLKRNDPPEALFCVRADNPTMLRMMQKYVAPYCTSITETHNSFKVLHPPTGFRP